MALVLAEDIWIFPATFLCVAAFVFAIKSHANDITRLVIAATANAIVFYCSWILYVHYGLFRVCLHISIIIALIFLGIKLVDTRKAKTALQSKE